MVWDVPRRQAVTYPSAMGALTTLHPEAIVASNTAKISPTR
ncbi:hypothetical protein D082_10730 [Synechocystis sp. PCC 6714]|nr:hypothetical protein D082_10730 [Synechocystis sp. PCC 6714]